MANMAAAEVDDIAAIKPILQDSQNAKNGVLQLQNFTKFPRSDLRANTILQSQSPQISQTASEFNCELIADVAAETIFRQ
ncbi:MAG: hypothetical protein K8L97_06240 [Anaerolineae bacterium]|nr:hypothetical protein [Anaerolineae bacterium]